LGASSIPNPGKEGTGGCMSLQVGVCIKGHISLEIGLVKVVWLRGPEGSGEGGSADLLCSHRMR
jgi:hypothetical protein